MTQDGIIRERGSFTPQERGRQVAAWGYRWYLVARHNVRQWWGLESVSVESVYPNMKKLQYRPPSEVPVPELRGVPIMAEASHLSRGGTYTVPEDYVAVLHDVLYCPQTNLLLSEDRKIIAESLSTKIIDIEPLREAEVEYRRGCHTLMRSLHNAHGHMLTENMPRLLALDDPPCDEEEIKVLCPGGPSSVENYLYQKIAPPNARLEMVEPDRLYRLERVLFTPFKTRRMANYLPRRYVKLFREKVLPERPPRHDHRYLISRGNHSRSIANRDELLSALADRGFEKLVPESLSPEEEVQVFYDAEVIMGAHGSGLANSIFSVDAKVIELSPFWYLSPHFFFLCKSLDHEYGLWSGPGSSWMPASFTVDVDDVMRLVNRMNIQ